MERIKGLRENKPKILHAPLVHCMKEGDERRGRTS